MATDTLTSKNLGGLALHAVSARTEYMNILIYGDSGVGKTFLAGSAEEVAAMAPVLVLDFEGGTLPLANNFPGVQQVRIETWKQMQAVYDDLHRTKGGGFKTILVDSLTEVQKFNMYDIMAETVKLRPDQDIDVPSMREWGKNLEAMRKFVRAFRDLPVNTIFTALKKDDKNDRTGMVTTKPSLSGKMGDEVAAFLDVVAYYYIKRIGKGEDALDKRLLLCRKTETIIAKDRTGRLPIVVEEPTMAMLYDLFQSTPANK